MSFLLSCICNQSFPQKYEYIKHVRSCERLKRNQGKIKCPICVEEISNVKLNFHEGKIRDKIIMNT